MVEKSKELLAFNRGVVSPKGLARIDLERMSMSAETQTNWMPRVLGSMMVRPGMELIDPTRINYEKTLMVPFVFSTDDTAMLHFRNDVMAVYINDEPLIAPAVTSVVTNSTFLTTIAGWTDASQTGGSVSWITGGYAGLKGDGTDFGILRQTVTINETGVEQWLSVFVEEGPVRFKLGSTVGGDEYIEETRLDRGSHHFAFTPTGNVTIELANEREFYVLVDTVWFYQAGVGGEVKAVTSVADDELYTLRYAQANDVVYFAAEGVPLQKVERRGNGKSWSVAKYLPEDGPFRVQNTTGITMTPSAVNGNITITASEGYFRQEHADNRSLLRIDSIGQDVTKDISSENDFTIPIRVVGNDLRRDFTVLVQGAGFTATMTLQFAYSEDGPWNDAESYTVVTNKTYSDGQDGQIIYYRLGVKSGDYTTGTITCRLIYSGGSIQGVARITGYTSPTVVDAVVLSPYGSITASSDWYEGEWSDRRGWPSAVALHEGRLWWAGESKIYGSISDQYESFDDNQEGDSGPISRTIAHGPVKIIHWLLSMGRLLFGTSENSANVGAAFADPNNPLTARSTSFDEPLSPSNFNIKTISSRGVFVDQSQQRLYELTYNVDQQDYKPLDLSVFAPDFNDSGIIQMAVQYKPDIRVHCVRNDGTVGVLIFDRLEEVICWVEVTSPGASGVIESVAVLPGAVEDQVYYCIKRTIDGVIERHICKWAKESEAVGGQLNKMADSFVVYDGVSTTTPFTTELLRLQDETVVVWADGKDIGEHTVSGTGGLTLTTAASKVVAGFGYTAQFKSAKLGQQDSIGLLETKRINRLGFVAENMHYQGLQYGPDFSNLSDLPQVSGGQVIAEDTIYASYHEDNFPFGGTWEADSRICLQVTAPRPCTILAAIAEMESLERMRRR
jgi:hypothetical protein